MTVTTGNWLSHRNTLGTIITLVVLGKNKKLDNFGNNTEAVPCFCALCFLTVTHSRRIPTFICYSVLLAMKLIDLAVTPNTQLLKFRPITQLVPLGQFLIIQHSAIDSTSNKNLRHKRRSVHNLNVSSKESLPQGDVCVQLLTPNVWLSSYAFLLFLSLFVVFGSQPSLEGLCWFIPTRRTSHVN